MKVAALHVKVGAMVAMTLLRWRLSLSGGLLSGSKRRRKRGDDGGEEKREKLGLEGGPPGGFIGERGVGGRSVGEATACLRGMTATSASVRGGR